ncbi:phosphoethanolamine transferase [Citrobacter sp. FDAARGOS_156]|uniref:phosphoethanolamine transferase n=1 Tax=Citrobacter sp. FDAARGOS_156 TaxID=1702170 RepID=UPI0019014563|nr:phosphoethanolamine transferase [Citrobacter sp. FDAARGOS_156]MBJ9559432.1 phosphoethanolamine transferase [Citrobacter sp. FDAARGOS_156]
MQKKYKQYILITFLLVPLFLLSKFTLRATGDSHPEVFNIIVLLLLISFTLGSKKSYRLITLPVSIIVGLYAPVGFTYGFPSYQYVSSLFATDGQESLEFLTLIPSKSYVYAFLIPVIFYMLHLLSYKFKIRPIKNRAYVMMVAIILTISSGALVFIKKAGGSINDYKEDQAELSKYVNKNDWGEVHLTNNSKYDDYILIIGESARRDYFHVYGYPVGNTPFLDSVNADIVNGLTSGGTYTIGSLRMMLTQGDPHNWQPHYNQNIMGLVNRAGIESYWLSNQGQFGEWDSPVSAIAKNAQYSYFTKFQGYNESNIQDTALLRKLMSVLSKSTNKKRFIVLHTMGSHPNVCDRIKEMDDQYRSRSRINNYIACYISSIRQTDDFLKETYNILKSKNSGRSFSMIYFSDHGLVHREINGEIKLNNNYASKYHHDIPLVKISSDDDKRTIVTSRKSGLMFVNGLATWMGIVGDSISPYNLFDGISSTEDYGLSKQAYKVDDPAVDITYDLNSGF